MSFSMLSIMILMFLGVLFLLVYGVKKIISKNMKNEIPVMAKKNNEIESKDISLGMKNEKEEKRENKNEIMPIIISIVVLICALFVVLSDSKYSNEHQKWAFGAIGTILGFWLKK